MTPLNTLETIVETIVDALVEPSPYSITPIEVGDTVILQVEVPGDDMGKIIGRQGTLFESISMITRAIAAKHGIRVYVELQPA